MNINEEGKYYASMVRKFRTEYKSKNLHGFCKEQNVSYIKMLYNFVISIFLVSLLYEIRREIHTGYKCASA